VPGLVVSTPLFSVVIPAIKVDDFLHMAVESALRDVGPAGEVIVVFDGPMHPVQAGWAFDPRVTIEATRRPGGTPVALNLGLRLARAEYIVRLDADDIAVEGRSARLHRQIVVDKDCIAVGSWAELIDDLGNHLGTLRMPVSSDLVHSQLVHRNALIHSSVMYRREPVLLLGGYNERCTRMQDYELFLRLAKVASLKNVPLALIKYRVHVGQASRCSSPYRRYTWEVLCARMALARATERSWISAFVNNLVWWVAQVARHHGLRKARYVTF
jgi:glycosyltransferase involved in cell wall biosynthesis